MNPRVLKPEGFKWLDRVVDICAKEGIYTIIDLHAVAGGQNTVRLVPLSHKLRLRMAIGLAFR